MQVSCVKVVNFNGFVQALFRIFDLGQKLGFKKFSTLLLVEF